MSDDDIAALREKYGDPIVIVKMTRAAFERALHEGTDIERRNLRYGERTGQIVLTEEPS